MRFHTSLLCIFAIASQVACGDKGSGGDEETGGTSSTAGTTSTSAGTSSTSAGTSSDAGTSSSSGGTTGGGAVTKTFSFDADVEKFIIQDSSAADGVTPVPKADVMLSHNADDGSPDPGSLQLDIPFKEASQYVSAGVNLDPGVDVTGKKLKAMVKIVSGYGSEEDIMTAPANAKLYIKTGATYLYASASVANITSIGTWVAIEFDPELPGYQAEGDLDLKDVKEIGIQMDTNSASMSATDAVVLIDSISY
jgi:hypothetical protein